MRKFHLFRHKVFGSLQKDEVLNVLTLNVECFDFNIEVLPSRKQPDERISRQTFRLTLKSLHCPRSSNSSLQGRRDFSGPQIQVSFQISQVWGGHGVFYPWVMQLTPFIYFLIILVMVVIPEAFGLP